MKENTEASGFVSKEIGLELNDKNAKYMVMSWNHHAVQNHDIGLEVINHLKGWNASNIWEHP